MGLGKLVSTTNPRTTNQPDNGEIGEGTGDAGLGPKQAWGKSIQNVAIRVQRTNASTNGRGERNTHGDAGCLASVEKRGRS